MPYVHQLISAEYIQRTRFPLDMLPPQTACHDLGPADDCLVLLSGGAAAGIAPADVALLMHRMGGVSLLAVLLMAPVSCCKACDLGRSHAMQ